MRLALKNIECVKAWAKDGVIYNWFVCMKSNRVSDSLSYVNYDDRGRTTADVEYAFSRLPKTIQKFVLNSMSNDREKATDVGGGFHHIIYY